VSDSRSTRLARDHADRDRTAVKVPNFLAGSTNDNRRCLDVRRVERSPEPAIEAGMKFLNVYLGCGKAKIANLGYCRIGIIADCDD
jgi:hypothetical protein